MKTLILITTLLISISTFSKGVKRSPEQMRDDSISKATASFTKYKTKHEARLIKIEASYQKRKAAAQKKLEKKQAQVKKLPQYEARLVKLQSKISELRSLQSLN